MKRRWDVIVVGGGPAGASAARGCALRGMRTILLEKERLPRYKPCAGGVNSAGVAALDFPVPRDLIERECNEIRIVFDGVERRVSSSVAFTYMVTRSDFDAFLVKTAAESGAVVAEGEALLSLELGGEGATAVTRSGAYRAPVVIGADGCFSRVRRAAGFAFGEGERLVCMIADIPLGEEEVARRFGRSYTVSYGMVERGYGWLFPKKSHVSAGIGGDQREAGRLPAVFDAFLESNGLPRGVKARGCFLPATNSRHRSFGERVLLAGDAAGFVDAFTGEGIRFALASGNLAAETAFRCHERGDFSAGGLKEYEDRWYSSFGEDLVLSRRVSDRAFSHKALAFGAAFGNRRALGRYLATLTGELKLGEYLPWLKKRLPFLLIGGAPLVFRFWMRGLAESARGRATPHRGKAGGRA